MKNITFVDIEDNAVSIPVGIMGVDKHDLTVPGIHANRTGVIRKIIESNGKKILLVRLVATDELLEQDIVLVS